MKYVYLSISLFFVCLLNVNAQLSVDTTYSVERLVKEILIGPAEKSVTVENIQFKGSSNAIGLVMNNSSNLMASKKLSSNMIFIRGLFLSTGDVSDVIGPNNSQKKGTINLKSGDHELNKIAKGKTADAAVLEFDFIPSTDSISFNFIFASEEYNEFVGSEFNDVFAFFLSGPGFDETANLAVIPGTETPITVNTVNGNMNKHFFISNKKFLKMNPGRLFNDYTARIEYVTQFDGMTKTLKAEAKVQPNQKYHIKIAIADVNDSYYDSGVFLQAESFKSNSTVNTLDVVVDTKEVLNTEQEIQEVKEDVKQQIKEVEENTSEAVKVELKEEITTVKEEVKVEEEKEVIEPAIEEPKVIEPAKEDELKQASRTSNFVENEKLKSLDNGNDVSVKTESGKTIVTINVEFETNSSEIPFTAYYYLSELSQVMVNNPDARLSVNGYTDNVGAEEANLKLSEARALSIYNYILSKGIEKNKLSYKGFGEQNPIATNDTEVGKAKNRRVEFVFE